jgi:subtilisin family serine protease
MEPGGPNHKLDPKIRMESNGDEVVNALRAERSASIAVNQQSLLAEVPNLLDPQRPIAAPQKAPRRKDMGSLTAPPETISTSTFVVLRQDSDRLPEALRKPPPGAPKPFRKEHLVTAAVRLSDLSALRDDPDVIAVETAEPIQFSPPLAVAAVNAPPTPESRWPDGQPLDAGPQQILLGIIDVQGFDFGHPDFLTDDGQPRFLAIWDQGGNTRPGPAPFGYGAEIRREHIQAALAGSREAGLPATELEPQSQMIASSHATHVTSIAGGNLGVCPQALLAGVLVSLPAEDQDRRRSFYDSTRLAHAVEYLLSLGRAHGLPVSINISLGTNGHAHDASSATSRWIDYALATPGRSVCVAAGNAGQQAPANPGDWGFVLGRIHTSGQLVQDGEPHSLEWVVVGDGIADVSENELEIWYSPQDRLAVEVKAPDGDWIGPFLAGEYLENHLLDNGTVLSLYHEPYAPPNGHHYLACYLSPFFSPGNVVGVRAGTWRVRLTPLDIRDGSYHGWIERDDPRRLGRLGMQEAWAFPSFFTETVNVDQSSVSSLACGQHIVAVANLDAGAGKIHLTSSQGPTRDGRFKPEVAAPGTNIVAANGFAPGEPWVSMTGTSMASPMVAGLIGLMLSHDPSLTAAQIIGILRRTARPLPSDSFAWRDDSGFGQLDPVACVEEAKLVRLRQERQLP